MKKPDTIDVVQRSGSGNTPPLFWLIVWAIWDGAGLFYFAFTAQSGNANEFLSQVGIIPAGIWLIGSIVLLALAIRALMSWGKQRRELNRAG